jgi:hypothetical protein
MPNYIRELVIGEMSGSIIHVGQIYQMLEPGLERVINNYNSRLKHERYSISHESIEG